MPGNGASGARKNEPEQEADQDLDSAVSVWVIVIRRTRREYQPNQYQARRKNIRCRFETVRTDSRRVCEPSDGNLQNRQQSADDHPENRELPGSFHLTGFSRQLTARLSALLISNRAGIRRIDIVLGLAGGFRVGCELHSLLIRLHREIVMVLQIVNLTLTHERQHACVEIEFLQLPGRFRHFPEVAQCPIQIVKPELKIAGLVVYLFPRNTFVAGSVLLLQPAQSR